MNLENLTKVIISIANLKEKEEHKEARISHEIASYVRQEKDKQAKDISTMIAQQYCSDEIFSKMHNIEILA